jgi:hypothetical protein
MEGILESVLRGLRRKRKKKPPKERPDPPPLEVPGHPPRPPEGPQSPSGGVGERERYVAGVKGRVGGRYCSPPRTGCTDCSGLVSEEYKDATGRWVSPDSHELYRSLPRISGFTDLTPGDLLFWDTGGERYGNRAGHVATAIGGGRAVSAMNPSMGIIEHAIDARMGGPYIGARRLPWKSATSTPTPSPPSTPVVTSYAAHAVAGSASPLMLPSWIRFRQQLTPRGPNRSGAHMTPTATVAHSTNNPRPSADAGDHANWQANGTPGHPDGNIGVHFYVDAKEIVQTIPINEQGVHSGDWRNQWGIAVERTTNAGQDQAEAENNAQHLHAGLLFIIDKTAKQSLYPHTDGGHCPILIDPWPVWEEIVDRRIERIRAAA